MAQAFNFFRQQKPKTPPPLTEEFLERFERYAQEASTKKLRQKWRRALSSEIREPGRFSLRVLRIPLKHALKTVWLFDFKITRQLARNHQHERAACLSVHAVFQFERFKRGRMPITIVSCRDKLHCPCPSM
jgi:hypothetical protein